MAETLIKFPSHTARFKKGDEEIYIAWHPKTRRIILVEGLTEDTIGMMAPLVFSFLLSTGWQIVKGNGDEWYDNKIGTNRKDIVGEVQQVRKQKVQKAKPIQLPVQTSITNKHDKTNGSIEPTELEQPENDGV